jgi:vacuolar-type H+-ATPase subunit I/STV1
MEENQGSVPTEQQGEVGQSQQTGSSPFAMNGNTSPPSSVSGQGSDPSVEKRIRDLMSQLDKTRNDLSKSVQERAAATSRHAQLEQQLRSYQDETTKKLEESANATKAALEAVEQERSRAANLEELNAKLQVILDNPELVVFKDTIVATPREKLEAVVSNLKAGLGMNRSSLVEQMKTGQVPPASAARSPGDFVMNSQQARVYLREAMNDPKEFERRRAELARAEIRIGKS